MKRVFLLAILVMACGCKRSDYAGSEGSATLSFTPSFSADNAADKADSRATATSFEDGDRVGVYVVKEGQALRGEFNAADNHLFAYFAVGDSLGSVPMAMYYPDKSTPVAIYAYYPYNYSYSDSGGERFSALAMPFNVAKNQRAGVTASDLCLSVGDFAAPSASPRSLTFYHALSQVVVNVDHSAVADVDSLYSVRFLGVRSGVLVNLADGVLTLQDAPSSVIANSVAILPPQTFEASKLIEIQMRMKDQTLANYYFNPLSEITIEAKKRNALSLKLRNDYTAELSSELAISPWIGGAGNGQLTDKVSNEFTLTYLNPKQGFTNIDRVVLTIAGKEYEAENVTVKNNGDVSANIAFSLKNNTPKEYPFTITSLKLYTNNALFLETNKDKDLKSSEVYKTGAKMLACGSFIPPTVEIAGTKWCTTNLTGTPGQSATIELCEKPEDYGMYFKWQDSWVFNFNSPWQVAYSVSPGDPCRKLDANYRTPTRQEIINLINSGNKPRINLNGTDGTFFGPGAASLSGNQSRIPLGMIFVPSAGQRAPNGNFAYTDYIYLWTSTPAASTTAYIFYYDYSTGFGTAVHDRGYGFSMRCVQD